MKKVYYQLTYKGIKLFSIFSSYCVFVRQHINLTCSSKAHPALQCISTDLHLPPYSRNGSYILMTSWLAAGLVLPHTAIISFQSQEDVNNGDEEQANWTGVKEWPWLLAKAHVLQLMINLFFSSLPGLTFTPKIHKTNIYLHNQDVCKSFCLSSHVNNKMIMKM